MSEIEETKEVTQPEGKSEEKKQIEVSETIEVTEKDSPSGCCGSCS